jgi:hypothetical protein
MTADVWAPGLVGRSDSAVAAIARRTLTQGKRDEAVAELEQRGLEVPEWETLDFDKVLADNGRAWSRRLLGR